MKLDAFLGIKVHQLLNRKNTRHFSAHVSLNCTERTAAGIN
jgi:hypothetical protein